MRALASFGLWLVCGVLSGCPDNPPRDDAGFPPLCADAGSSPACPLTPPVVGDECDDALTCIYCDEAGVDAGVARWCDGLSWSDVEG